MAVQFVEASNEYYYVDDDPWGGAGPTFNFTVAIWHKRDTQGSANFFTCTPLNFRKVWQLHNSSTNVMAGLFRNATFNQSPNPSATHTLASDWTSFVMTVTSSSVISYWNGTAQTTGSHTDSLVAASRTAIGVLAQTLATASDMDGQLGDACVWVGWVATQAEVNELLAGKDPRSMGRGSLTNWYPLQGDGPVGTRTRDWGPQSMHMGSVGGTPTKGEYGAGYARRRTPDG